jgi:hypothetical protein
MIECLHTFNIYLLILQLWILNALADSIFTFLHYKLRQSKITHSLNYTFHILNKYFSCHSDGRNVQYTSWRCVQVVWHAHPWCGHFSYYKYGQQQYCQLLTCNPYHDSALFISQRRHEETDTALPTTTTADGYIYIQWAYTSTVMIEEANWNGLGIK